MTARKSQADKDAAAAAAAEQEAAVADVAPTTYSIPQPSEATPAAIRTPAIADGSSELPADLGNIASPGPDTIPVYKDGELVPDTAVDGQEIDLAGQRVMLDALAETLAGLDAADIGRAIDEARAQAGLRTGAEPAVYLIHPVKGHAVHVTLTQAIADSALGWADATLDDIRRAGLTS